MTFPDEPMKAALRRVLGEAGYKTWLASEVHGVLAAGGGTVKVEGAIPALPERLAAGVDAEPPEVEESVGPPKLRLVECSDRRY